MNYNYQYLYVNLKNGDALAFYHTKWYMIFSKLIAYFSGFKMDHIACVANIMMPEEDWDEEKIYFDLYEATTIKGVHRTRYYLTSDGDTDLPLENRLLYYIPLKKKMTNGQTIHFIKSLDQILGRKFDWFHCILVPFNRIITYFNKDYKNKILPKAFCALYVAVANRDAGLIKDKEYWRDPYMTPYQVAQYSCYKNIYEIKVKK